MYLLTGAAAPVHDFLVLDFGDETSDLTVRLLANGDLEVTGSATASRNDLYLAADQVTGITTGAGDDRFIFQVPDVPGTGIGTTFSLDAGAGTKNPPAVECDTRAEVERARARFRRPRPARGATI